MAEDAVCGSEHRSGEELVVGFASGIGAVEVMLRSQVEAAA
jgi:hypothetical protein